MKNQLIFLRYELKYLINEEQYTAIIGEIKSRTHPDEYGESSILSLYYDTDDSLLIRRSIEHPSYKEKLRLRSYGVPDEAKDVFVELKKKYDGVVYKRRIKLPAADAVDYLSGERQLTHTQISDEIDYFKKFYKGLRPAMLLCYDRVAYYGDGGLRITFDSNICWRDDDLDLQKGGYGEALLDTGERIMEIKTGGAIPMWLTKLLSEYRIYKTTFSKYGSAYTQAKKAKGR
jgi:SPX domain-containing protein involved in vacuolar polyphosphate accumulation